MPRLVAKNSLITAWVLVGDILFLDAFQQDCVLWDGVVLEEFDVELPRQQVHDHPADGRRDVGETVVIVGGGVGGEVDYLRRPFGQWQTPQRV